MSGYASSRQSQTFLNVGTASATRHTCLNLLAHSCTGTDTHSAGRVPVRCNPSLGRPETSSGIPNTIPDRWPSQLSHPPPPACLRLQSEGPGCTGGRSTCQSGPLPRSVTGPGTRWCRGG
jgi:hypothetical protein